MTKRYNHWFWNSKFVDWLATKVTRFGNYLWRKRFSRK